MDCSDFSLTWKKCSENNQSSRHDNTSLSRYLPDFCRESLLSHGGSKQWAFSHRQHNMAARTRTDRCWATMIVSDPVHFPLRCVSVRFSSALLCSLHIVSCWVSVLEPAFSLTRLVLVMRLKGCEWSDRFSQQTSGALNPFWLLFYKLALAASQSWWKGRLAAGYLSLITDSKLCASCQCDGKQTSEWW